MAGVKNQKILQSALLFFVFFVSVGAVFFGIQWLSNSVASLLIHRNNLFSSSLEKSVSASDTQVPGAQSVSIPEHVLPLRDWRVGDINLKTESAISVDVESGLSKVLFKKDEDKQLPIASLTKLMTALVVLENYDLSKKVIISKLAMAQEGDQGDLTLGQEMSIRNLLYITLMESSNKAAFALGEDMGTSKFVETMNANAKKMGLKNTHFQDDTGLDPKSYSSAKDVVVLSKYLFETYPLFREIINLKEYDLYLDDGTFHHHLVNTNKILGENDIIGGKTGFTNNAKGCMMVIQHSPKPTLSLLNQNLQGDQERDYLITVVLGSEDRFAETQSILQWASSAYLW